MRYKKKKLRKNHSLFNISYILLDRSENSEKELLYDPGPGDVEFLPFFYLFLGLIAKEYFGPLS